MKTKQTIVTAALALLSTSAAFAQSELDLQHVGTPQASTVSRAAVRADVLSAIANHELTAPSEVQGFAVSSRARNTRTAGLTRAQVKAELAGADMTTPPEVTAWNAPGSSTGSDVVRAEARARSETGKDRERIGAGH